MSCARPTQSSRHTPCFKAQRLSLLDASRQCFPDSSSSQPLQLLAPLDGLQRLQLCPDRHRTLPICIMGVNNSQHDAPRPYSTTKPRLTKTRRRLRRAVYFALSQPTTMPKSWITIKQQQLQRLTARPCRLAWCIYITTSRRTQSTPKWEYRS